MIKCTQDVVWCPRAAGRNANLNGITKARPHVTWHVCLGTHQRLLHQPGMCWNDLGHMRQSPARYHTLWLEEKNVGPQAQLATGTVCANAQTDHLHKCRNGPLTQLLKRTVPAILQLVPSTIAQNNEQCSFVKLCKRRLVQWSPSRCWICCN